jgi:hypothetical protein
MGAGGNRIADLQTAQAVMREQKSDRRWACLLKV